MPNRLKELRNSKGLSMKQMSKDLVKKKYFDNITDATLSNYENEKREPKLDTWKKLADYFGVDVGYLQGVTNLTHTKPDFFNTDHSDMEPEEYFNELEKYLGQEDAQERTENFEANTLKSASKKAQIVFDAIQSTRDYPNINYNESISDLNLRLSVYVGLVGLVNMAADNEQQSVLQSILNLISNLNNINNMAKNITADMAEWEHSMIDQDVSSIRESLIKIKRVVEAVEAQNKKATDD
ncbi:helix-turn-helix domain-containing protein [Leuconostoc citreum]|uniref:helix-turn-helix domain-containing protein n=1 Tax=Leuconostoc citreum TaxID=33964 RepID=UPI0012BA52A3|nr:helix-turn-helix domain-containing protein [Leuconostoc citreum]MCS8594534.1 helix-turn-helix domain-containing protein [Leuconostoc citreum]QGN60523.1 helix-turn-helix domain-containing protein [Leuconostoc citreum]